MSTLERPWRDLPAKGRRALLEDLLRQKAARPKRVPLSFAQRELWLLDRLAPGSSAYNVAVALAAEGDLDVAALAAALDAIVRRHETLRTTFETAPDGEPRQVVAPSGAADLALADLSGLRGAERQDEVRLWTARLRHQLFDLEKGPLLRVRLLRLGPAEWVLVIALHHIVADGWSLSVFVREMAALYEAALYTKQASGQPAPLPPLPVQYSDFVRWQREWLQSGAHLSDQLGWWRERLAGAPPLLELPTDRARPAVRVGRGASQLLELDRGLVDRLNALGQGEGATLFMTLLAGLQALLLRHSGQEDVCVGTPIAGRDRHELEGLIGLFVNLLVMRTDLTGAPGFRQLLHRVRDGVLGAFAHQDVPFERLVSDLGVERNLSRTPLFQVAFASQNVPPAGLERPRLSLRSLPAESAATKYDLTVEAQESAGGLRLFTDYDRDLFDATTVLRLLGHLEVLLAGAAAAPDTPLSALPLLAAGEAQQLVREWNDTHLPGEASAELMHHLFEARAALSPEAPAIASPAGEISYGELDRRANRLAHHLLDLGVGPGSLVAVYLERSPETIVAVLGVLKAGAAYVPFDSSYPEARITWILGNLGIRCMVTGGARLELVSRIVRDTQATPLTDVVVLDADPEAGEAWDAPVRRWDVRHLAARPAARPAVSGAGGDDIAYVIFTSGTTGTPKGVVIRHRPVINLIEWVNRTHGVGSGDRLLFVTSLCFDLSVYDIFGTLAAGGSIRVAAESESQDPEQLLAILLAEPITFWDSAPAALQQLVPFLPQPGSVAGTADLRLVFLSGDWIPVTLPDRIRGLFPGARVISLGGATEATIWSNFYPIGEVAPQWVSIPYGRPISNARYHVLGSGLEPCPAGVSGDLYIGGDCLFMAYAEDPSLTAWKLIPDPWSETPGGRLYRTGDRSRYWVDGNLEFLGRVDHQVKIRGFRIELGEIEAALLQHPAVRSAAAIVREDRPGDRRLVAYVVGEPGAEPAPAELRQHLQERLPAYMLPSAFVPLSNLPVTANGKLDRRALPAPGAQPIEEAAEPVAPSAGNERILAGVWCEVLGLERVSVHSNFFELGGDSILVIQLVSRAAAAGLRFAPRQVFETPTIAGLAQALEAAAAAEAPAGADAGPAAGPVALTPIQRWFFTQELIHPEHFNQALVVAVEDLGGAVSGGLLARAWRQVTAHHDALRLRFSPSETGWRQWHAEPGPAREFAWIDLSTLPAERFAAALESAAAALQASLDLGEGPLARLALLTPAAGRPRLLAVIHHLAIDGVSWRILLEDLETVCRQLAAGAEPVLPAKTASFGAWAARLEELAGAAETAAEAEYWLETLPAAGETGPEPGCGLVGRAGSVKLSLGTEETRALLKEVPRAYRAQVNEVLLTALARAFAKWSGRSRVLLELEGHGREDVVGLDVSRTVGWFTALFPVALDLAGAGGAPAALRAVKEQLRAVPRRGLGFGLLRHLGSGEAAAGLAALPRAEVLFNYLGQLDASVDEGRLFRPAAESTGPVRHPAQQRSHAFEVNCAVAGGRLHAEWIYSRDHHQEAAVEVLARSFLAALAELISLRGMAEAALGVSDFPLVRVEPQELERLLAKAPEAGGGIEDLLPLSPLQQGMLFHALDDPASGAYVEQVRLGLDTDGMDLPAFERAWEELLERHAVLRTGVWMEAAAPFAVLYRHPRLSWRREDWRGLSGEERRRRLDAFLDGDRRRGFDLTRPPLLRLTWIELGERRAELVWTFHHILCDGWSLPILLRDLQALYQGLRRSEPAHLATPPAYRDYLAWLAAQDAAAAERFWRGKLAGFATPTPFGFDRPRPGAAGAGAEPRNVEVLAALPVAQSDALRSFTRHHQVTLNTLFQGAWALLLSAYSDSGDVVFGAVTAGRSAPLPGIEEMVGLLINTLPARVRLAPQSTPVAWLQEIQRQQSELRQFEHSGLHQVRGWSEVAAGQPLFESILVFENYPLDESVKEQVGGGLGVRTIDVREQTNYPLSLTVEPRSGLYLRLAYDPQRFERATVLRLLAHLETVLSALAGETAPALAAIPVLPAAERHQVMVEWNTSPALSRSPACCLHGLFEAQVARTPQAPAVSFEGRSLTYAELDVRANCVASFLRQLGVGPDVPVAICMERSLELMVGLLGILKVGGAYVPLDPSYPTDRLAFMLEDALGGVDAPVLVTHGRVASLATAASAVPALWTVDLDADWQAIEQAGSNPPPPLDLSPDGLAYVIYTSGSTGRPKGAMNTHRAICNRLLWMQQAYGLSAEDRVMQKTPISFDVSVWELFWPLLTGAQLVLARPEGHKDAAYLVDLIASRGITTLHFVPSMLRAFLDEPDLDRCVSLRRVIASGEALPLEVEARFHEQLARHGAGLHNLYGPTEAAVDVTYRALRPEEGRTIVPIGRPIANIDLRLDSWREVPLGVPGELCIGGMGLARGYWRRPELTAERFVPHPSSARPGERLYRTGDLARYLTDGEIEYLGRLDYQVKIRGFRIELGEIESVLGQHPLVREAVVLAREDRPGERRLVAYVVPAGFPGPAAEELRGYLLERLPEHMVPSALVFLETLPLSVNGKLDRKALPAPELGRGEAEGAYVAPRTATEELLAGIWQELLRLPQIGVHDNFFELGGDSILAIQLVSRAARVGLHLAPRHLFEAPTIAGLATRVTEAPAPAAAEADAAGGPVPLTPIQAWFFEQELVHPEQFSQALIAEVEDLGAPAPAVLARAWDCLAAHHDALRLRFAPDEAAGGWRQWRAEPGPSRELVRIDLSALPAERFRSALESAADALQESLDLTAGPLARLALLTPAEGRPRLLTILHHLAIDGVSWRVLLEDLETACRQIAAGTEPSLPPRTASFAAWAERLRELAAAPETKAEAGFWLHQAERSAARLPVEVESEPGEDADRVALAGSLVVAFSAEETRVLLQEVPRTYRAQINEVLLAALACAFQEWTGEPGLLLDLEGHGRDAAEDLDLSRTVGWLTTLYPVALDIAGAGDAPAALRAVKEQLRAVPRRGLGYGLLRYMDTGAAAGSLRDLPRPEVIFNYLGQLDSSKEEMRLFRQARESAGAVRHPAQRRSHALEINCAVSGDRLQVDWTYSRGRHRESTIEALAGRFFAALAELIALRGTASAAALTVSDFPLVTLAQSELEALLAGAPERGSEVEDVQPLSPLQQGMLFHALDDPSSGMYVEQIRLGLDPDGVDLPALERAWEELWERHAVLRSGVWLGSELPLAVIHRRLPLAWRREDWRGFSTEEQERRLAAFLEEDRRRGFDLTRPPLARLAWIELGAGRAELVWSFHHILFDGWSLPILLGDLLALYQGLKRGEPARLATPPAYRDYLAWLGRQDADAAERFWRGRLAGFAAPTPLGLDSRSGAVAEEGGAPGRAELQVLLPAARSDSLRSFTRRHQITLNTLFQGAWARLLSAYGGSGDVVFGAVTAGRSAPLPGIQEMVGLLINTLPARVRLAPQSAPAAWLQEIQRQQSELGQFEHSGLHQVRAWSEVAAGQPLFESILVFENYPIDEAVKDQVGAGLGVHTIDVREQTNYPLGLIVEPGSRLSLRLAWDPRRFERTAMLRLLTHLETVLEALAAESSLTLSAVPMLPAAERHQVMVEWNATPALGLSSAHCLHELFEAQAARAPQAPAVVFEDRSLTYEELDVRSNCVASFLRRLGAGPDVPVAICMERSLELMVGLLGILKAGGAYVPLDPSYPTDRLAFMLEDALGGLAAPVLLTHGRVASLQPAAAAVPALRTVDLDADWPAIEEAGSSGPPPARDLSPDSLAYVIYTSGSTGRPKGAMNTHRAICNRLLWMQQAYGLGAEDRVMQKTPISFDVSVWELFWPLLTGAQLVLARPEGHKDAAYLVDLIASRGITTLHFVPSMLRAFLDEPDLDRCVSLRRVIASGEALPLEVEARFHEQLARHGAGLHNLYGPTEAAVDVTYRALRPEEGRTIVPIGRPIANIDLRLDTRGEVPLGIPGELCIGGVGLARGYWRRPELTADRFVPHPSSERPGERLYRTGDLARYLADGEIEYLGRLDHQVKIRGFRIELGEIESVLGQHPLVREAVVLAREDRPGERRLVAYTVLHSTDPANPADRPDLKTLLSSWLGERLPDYMVPAAFVVLETLPLSVNGKLDRKALPAPEAGVDELAFVAPRTVAEELLAGIWRELLRLPQVGVHDNFFELGGDSILAIQLVSRAARAGLRLAPRQVFEAPTVAGLAARALAAPSRTAAEAGPPAGPVPLTPIQSWFFEQDLLHPEHFNQALALEIEAFGPEEPGVLAGILARAWRRVAAHHDALRLRFAPGDPGGEPQRQWYAEDGSAGEMAWIDLSALPEQRFKGALEGAAAALQASLDLSVGPLARVALLTPATGRPRLAAIIHHLAVDGVSWRILLEDFETACRQLAGGAEPDLPPRTSSFGAWAESLRELAAGAEAAAEAGYWLERLGRAGTRLPADAGLEPVDASDRMDRVASVTVALGPEETRALLQEVPRACRTQINEVLLAALARAFQAWTGEPRLLLDLEGHGREEVGDLDVSRTVGWFTALFPVLLDLAGAGSPAAALRAVKEQLRAVPRRGLGFGLLRHLGDGAVAGRLRATPQAEVVFNYLGQLDASVEDGRLFRPAAEPAGPVRHPGQRRPHALEISGAVAGGRLQLSWSYSRGRYRASTIEAVAGHFLAALGELIALRGPAAAAALTVSDFPLARLEPQELERLLEAAELGGAVEDIYPASPLQQGMLFHSLDAPGSGVYVQQLSLALDADLDVEGFEWAWQELLHRHAILRTGFWLDAEEPLQLVLSRVRVPWHREDWRGVGEEQQRERLAAFLREDRRRGFDLARPPLLRLALLRLSEHRYQLVWTYHHLLLDGWSVPIVLRDLWAVFDSRTRGEQVHPARQTPRPFRDYISWLASQDRGAAEELWRARLRGFTTPTALGIDRTVPKSGEEAETRLGIRSLALPVAATDALRTFARRHRLTLNSLVQGAWALLLSRYGNEAEVVFGEVTSGRSASVPEIESMAGMFINTLPARIRIPAAGDLVPWLQGLQAAQAETRQYEYSSLSQIHGWSEVPRGQPLFESILAFDNFPLDEAVSEQIGRSLGVASVDVWEQTNYPLSLVASASGTLSLKVVLDLARFEELAGLRLLGHLENLLTGLTSAAPPSSLAAWSHLSAAERQQVLAEWNDTDRDCPQLPLVHELFAAHARRDPAALAVAGGGGALTYAEVDARANRLAHHLVALGVGPGTLVALCTERTLLRVVGIVAVLKAGAAYVSLDPTYPKERLEFLLEDAAPPVVLTEERFLGALPETRARVIRLDTDWDSIAGPETFPPARRVTPQDLAYVVYTSGSTGRPKGVEIPHAGLMNLVRWHGDLYQVKPSDRGTQIASPAFDASIWELWPYLAAGASVHIPDEEVRLSSPGMIRWWSEAGITLAYLMTPLAEGVLEEKIPAGLELPTRALIIGGDRLHRGPDPEVGFRLMNHYGPAEYSVTCTVVQVPPVAADDAPEGARDLPSVGRPIDNTRIYVLGRDLEPVPVGVPGELFVAGVGLARGYQHRPGLTAEKFLPDPFSAEPGTRMYRTADLVRTRPDGEIDFLGRLDNQVKIRGFRIELGEIEAVLGQHPAVREAVALVLGDRPGERRLVAYVVPAGSPWPTAGELRAYLRERLPDYMVPAVCVLLEALPLTSNGKVDRRALPAPEMARAEGEGTQVAPRTATEKLLAELWQKLLRIPQVGVYDNFFELGGDSILAIQLVSRAARAGLQLAPRQLFEAPTLADLAARVAVAPAVAAADAGPAAGPVLPTPIQRRFFEQGLVHPEHFNQSLVLEVETSGMPASRMAGALARAWRQVAAHHDALRLRFAPGGLEGWRQWYAEPGRSEELTWIDLSALGQQRFQGALERAAADLQTSLDLGEGPLTRLALFTPAEGRPRLAAVIHHLVIDGVSWRILLEDLEAACRQLINGAEPALPPRTASFGAWARRLQELAATAETAAEAGYWLERMSQAVARLPVDAGPVPGDGADRIALAASVTVALGPEETQALLQEVPRACRTQINEVLLTALAQAFEAWTGQPRLLLELEGHGREEAGDLDVSRSVGWFTTLCPVLLDLAGAGGPAAALRAVKEQLRAVPRRGFGFGLLRHLGDGEIAGRLRALPPAEVLFNYLGQLDASMDEENLFQPARESAGAVRHPAQQRSHPLEVNGAVVAGRLQVTWTYSPGRHQASTIEALAARFLSALSELAALRGKAAAAALTAADFPLARLAPRELERLLGAAAELGNEVEDIYPLSPLQQGMLFHSLQAPASGVYVQQMSLTLETGLDVEGFAWAWQELLERHAILRMGFWLDAEEPLQVVYSHLSMPWRREDWRGLTGEEQQQRLAELLSEERRRGFDFARPPLLRVALLQLAGRRHQLVWTFHHVLLDGWSMPLLLRDLWALCESRRRGEPARLSHLRTPRPFRDYIAWLGRQDEGAAEAFWRERLRGFTTPVALGLDRAVAKSHESAEGALGIRRAPLPAAATDALRGFARRHQLTLNTLVQGAWALLLSRYGSETDVVFGEVTSGRSAPVPEIESMLGLFINTLPARIRVAPAGELVPWLQRLQAAQAEMRQHEYSSLSQIQGWSGVTRGLPLFESILAFENFPLDEAVSEQLGKSLGVTSVEVREQTNYPLNLIAAGSGALELRAVYDRGRIEDTAALRLLGHLENLLTGLTSAAPPSSLAAWSHLSAAERQQVLAEWNDTDRDCPQLPLVHELFAAHARRDPAALAVAGGGGALTYAEVDARANRLAHHLVALGVGPGALVALCTERTLLRVVGIIAVLKAGAAYVSLDPTYPKERLEFLLEDAAAPVVLTEERFLGALPETRARVIRLDTDWDSIAGPETFPPARRVTPQDLAYVVYTSGSTGRPKGVEIPHAGLMNLVRWHGDLYQVKPSDRGTQIASPAFDASIWELWPYLAAGASVHIPDEEVRLSSPGMIRWWSEAGITLAYLMTPLAEGVLEEKIPAGLELPTRALIIGGDRLHRGPDPGVGFRLMNHYGPAEYSVTCTVVQVPPASAGDDLPSVGRPIDNTQIYVLGRDLEPVPVGIPGELFVAGVGLARGYLHRPDLTAEKFLPNPFSTEPGARVYRTADLVRTRPDGEIDFLGRLDNQVKVRGLRIELGEIEVVLGQHPEVREAAVLVRGDRTGNRRVVAYAVPAGGHEPRPEELRGFLAERLPEYMVPSLFVILESLPLTPNGKVDRLQLDRLELPSDRASAATVAPRTAVEIELVRLWEELLDVRPIGVRDSFFELGGHSLLCVRLRARIESHFGRELPLAVLFEEPTVEHLARALAEEAVPRTASPLVAIQPHGTKRPLFCLHPVGGEIVIYYALAQRLGRDQPVYGLQSTASLVDLEGPQPAIEELSASYLGALRQAQPVGPYRLAGSSFGGLLAFEMARQLAEQGEAVELVALFDTYPPAAMDASDDPESASNVLGLARELARQYGKTLELTLDQLAGLTGDPLLEKVATALRESEVIGSEVDTALLRRFIGGYASRVRAVGGYRPEPYPGSVVLFRARPGEESPGALDGGDLGWGELAAGGVTVHPVPGLHDTMLAEPHVAELAALLGLHLDAPCQ